MTDISTEWKINRHIEGYIKLRRHIERYIKLRRQIEGYIKLRRQTFWPSWGQGSMCGSEAGA
jgi:hypothetical protein